jgi:cell division protein FtsB
MASLGATVRDGAAAPRRGFAGPAAERTHRGLTLPGAGKISRLLIIGFALMGVATLGLLQVLQTSQVASTGFELRTLQAERTRLESEIRLLEANVAERSQLERLREEAVDGLGMVEPDQKLHLSVDEPAPSVIPLPRRYVESAPVIEPEPAPWWEPFLERIPGFD